MTIPHDTDVKCPVCGKEMMKANTTYGCLKCWRNFSEKSLADGSWKNREEKLEDHCKELMTLVRDARELLNELAEENKQLLKRCEAEKRCAISLADAYRLDLARDGTTEEIYASFRGEIR